MVSSRSVHSKWTCSCTVFFSSPLWLLKAAHNTIHPIHTLSRTGGRATLHGPSARPVAWTIHTQPHADDTASGFTVSPKDTLTCQLQGNRFQPWYDVSCFQSKWTRLMEHMFSSCKSPQIGVFSHCSLHVASKFCKIWSYIEASKTAAATIFWHCHG